MARDLPPLNALRMFDAAARHLNFTKASEELFVTQGAVSRQIKLLEENLQQALFERDGSKLHLTAAGEAYRDAVREGLAIIRRGTADIHRRAASPTLTISVLPSFATLWLVPRVSQFQAQHPNLSLQVTSSYDVIDFGLEPETDAAIRLGRGNWPGVYAECLFSTDVFPVCSPSLLKGSSPFNDVGDILEYPLVYATNVYNEWQRWFVAAGLRFPEPPPGTRYSDQQALQQAAIEGQGIALARSLLVESDLQSGRLVKPIDISVRSKLSYYFVCPSAKQDSENVRHLLTWLRQAATQYDNACTVDAVVTEKTTGGDSKFHRASSENNSVGACPNAAE